MPYLSVRTNVAVDDEAGMLKRLSQLIAGLTGKPERYVMVHLDAGVALLFAGSDQPAAYMQLKSLSLPEQQISGYSAALCKFIQAELGIGSDRIYIEFSAPEPHMWGWNGGTF